MKKNIAILFDEDLEHPNDYQYYSLSDINDIKTDCENIYIGDLLDYLEQDKVPETLVQIIDKLKPNGELHIKAPDILQLCWYCSKLHLDISKFRYIVYNTGRRSCYSIDEILMILSKHISNIVIQSSSYCNGYEYSITIKKNESN